MYFFKARGTIYECYTFDGKLHSCNDNPALIGQKNLKIWCHDGIIWRGNGKPSVVEFYDNGTIYAERLIVEDYWERGAFAIEY